MPKVGISGHTMCLTPTLPVLPVLLKTQVEIRRHLSDTRSCSQHRSAPGDARILCAAVFAPEDAAVFEHPLV